MYERWKQFVFYLFREIIHEKGDVIARKRFREERTAVDERKNCLRTWGSIGRVE